MTINDVLTKICGHEIIILNTDNIHNFPYKTSIYEKDGKFYDKTTEKCISDFEVYQIIASGVNKIMIFIKETQ